MPYESSYGRNFYGAMNGGNMGGALARGMFAGSQGIPTDNPMPQYHGINGFLDRFANPTTPLGNIGMAMLIGGGGPAGQAGEMLMANHRQKLLDAQATAASHAPDIRQVGDNLIQLGENGQVSTLFNGAKPDAPHAALATMGIDQNSQQGQAYLKLGAMRTLNPATTTLGVNADNAPIQRVSLASDIYGVNVNGQPPQGITGGQDGPQPPLGAGLTATGGVGPTPGALAPRSAPQPTSNSYKDPAYGQMEAAVESRFGLPPGLMSQIRTRGEMSNANQVSSAGAQSVYQITPSTRQLFLNKYGVDAYADPQSAATVAGLHLRDSIARGEDPVRGYIGGPNKAAWGRQTQAYASRVYGGQGSQPQSSGGWSAAPDRDAAMQQAQEAIAAGVDPALVHSRLVAGGFAQ